MHLRTRGVALLSVTAVLAGGSLTTISAASAADASTPSARLFGLPILGDLLSGILGQLAGATVATIQGLIDDLSPDQVGDLLQSATAGDLSKLLQAAQNTGQLPAAVDSLTAPEAGALLAPLTGSDLTRVLGALTASDLQAALGTLVPADLADVVDGLTAGQTTGLLSTANPTQLTRLLTALDATQLTNALSAGQLGDLLAPLSGANLTSVLGALTTTELLSALGTLTPTELNNVVDGLTAGQTTGLLSTANPTQLTSLLGALDATQLTNALGPLNATQLTTIVGALAPAQITGLIGAGATPDVITGLLGQTTGLAGGSPTAPQVDALLAQVTALLGGGIPADPTDLISLLGSVNALLGTSGLSPAVLTSLLGPASGLLGAAPAPVATPLQGLVTQITLLLGSGATSPGATTTTPGATTTTPGATITRPGSTTTRPAPAAPAAQFTGYRATVGALKLNKKRSSMRFTLTCAATAPKGCLVKVSAKVAGKSAMRSMTLALPKGKSTPVTVSLSKSTTRRLKTKGGSLKITAQTALSSLPSATRTLKVKRLKSARKAAR